MSLDCVKEWLTQEYGRRVPRLEFRRNQLTAEQQALEEEFERLRREG